MADLEVLPTQRHAVCGYVRRGALGTVRTQALCGAGTGLPQPETAEHCPDCVEAAQRHAELCSCFKLWPGTSRLPTLAEARAARAGWDQ